MIEDPAIAQARLVNDAARIERNLGARKKLRPVYSERSRKGWETRNAG